MTQPLREIIEEVTAGTGVNPLQVTTRCRKHVVVCARIQVARRLHARGYSASKIGEMLNHERTTIAFYLGKIKGKQPPKLRWREPRIRIMYGWRRFYPEEVAPLPKPVPPRRNKPRPRGPLPYAGFDPSERTFRWVLA